MPVTRIPRTQTTSILFLDARLKGYLGLLPSSRSFCIGGGGGGIRNSI